jgi:hypothetical protein
MAISRIGDTPPFCHGGFICIGRTTSDSVPSTGCVPVLRRRWRTSVTGWPSCSIANASLRNSSPGCTAHSTAGIGIQPSRSECFRSCPSAPAARPEASRQIGCTSGAPLKASMLPYSSKIDFCRPAWTPTTVQ